MKIIQLSNNPQDKIRKELIEFARNCSWQGTGGYFAELLENNDFEESEKIFIALDKEDMIGFAALVNESCVEDAEFSPWLDFLFVDEKSRNKGTARMLVEHILQVAESENVNGVYLCTASHERMYEKLGFRTLYKTIINGGDECTVMKYSHEK